MSAKDICCTSTLRRHVSQTIERYQKAARQKNPMLVCNYGTYLRVAFFYQSIAPSRRRCAHRAVVPAA
jgi:hypothetical protein